MGRKRTAIELGTKFNRWVVVGDLGTDADGKRILQCKCICGTVRGIGAYSLKRVIS